MIDAILTTSVRSRWLILFMTMVVAIIGGWQLNLLPLSALDREIGVAIIDAIDEDGFLRTSLEDRTLQAELPGYKEFTQKTRYRLFPGIW